jgi:hypothetical protein
MPYQFLPAILDDAQADIHRLEHRWQPKDLLFLSQAQETLRDLLKRYNQLLAARDEMQTLDRATRYMGYLSRLRFSLRVAHFTWKGDQLAFIRAVSAFYSDYGAVLRLLKEDSMRGKFPR